MSLLDYWDTHRPATKRRKTTDDATSRDAPPELSEQALDADTPIAAQTDEVSPDAEPPSSQTELESSLPEFLTDRQAIEEYENARVSELEESSPGLHERLRDGKWRKGKSSIYVDAFNLALETVLDEEAHLFSEAEMEVFNQWRKLSYESQYLYVSPLLLLPL
jgi:Fanconi-associated nuclease 1